MILVASKLGGRVGALELFWSDDDLTIALRVPATFGQGPGGLGAESLTRVEGFRSVRVPSITRLKCLAGSHH